MKRIVTYECEYCGLVGKNGYFIKNHELKCDKNERSSISEKISDRKLYDVKVGDTVILISDRGGTLLINLTLYKEYVVTKVDKERDGYFAEKFYIHTDNGTIKGYIATTPWFKIIK